MVLGRRVYDGIDRPLPNFGFGQFRQRNGTDRPTASGEHDLDRLRPRGQPRQASKNGGPAGRRKSLADLSLRSGNKEAAQGLCYLSTAPLPICLLVVDESGF